jgi:ribosomal protein S27AE
MVSCGFWASAERTARNQTRAWWDMRTRTLKSCPRCGGEVCINNELSGWQASCMQCGYTEYQGQEHTRPDTGCTPLPWPVPAHDLLSAVPARAASTVHHDRTARSAVESDLVAHGAAWGMGALRAAAACMFFVMSRQRGAVSGGRAMLHPTQPRPNRSCHSAFPSGLWAERDWVRGSASPGWTRSVAMCYITPGIKGKPALLRNPGMTWGPIINVEEPGCS